VRVLHPSYSLRHLDVNSCRYGIRGIVCGALNIDKPRKHFGVVVEETSAAIAAKVSLDMDKAHASADLPRLGSELRRSDNRQRVPCYVFSKNGKGGRFGIDCSYQVNVPAVLWLQRPPSPGRREWSVRQVISGGGSGEWRCWMGIMLQK